MIPGCGNCKYWKPYEDGEDEGTGTISTLGYCNNLYHVANCAPRRPRVLANGKCPHHEMEVID